jgi:hypothetical protein
MRLPPLALRSPTKSPFSFDLQIAVGQNVGRNVARQRQPVFQRLEL